MASLPQPRSFVSSIISSLRPPDNSSTIIITSSNPLSDATNETRKALLTLHVLFPHELLPALDLLDRNLVTRLIVQSQDEAAQQRSSPDPESREHQQPQARVQRHEGSQQPQTRRSQPQERPHQSTLRQSSNVTLPHLRPVQPLDSRWQPPPGLQPSNAEREVGGLLRPIQDSGQLGMVGDSVRQSSTLESADRLREVWRQQEGQGEVWTQAQHRGGGAHQGSDRSQVQHREKKHRSSNQLQNQLRQREEQHQAKQNSSPNPQRQTSREREILQHPQHRLSPSQPLRPEATHQEQEASTPQIRNEASIPRSAHAEESPLRRRAASQTQSLAPSDQVQEHHPPNPDQTLRHAEPALPGSPRRGGDQNPGNEGETGSGERQRRLHPESSEGVYMVRSAQVHQSGARFGRQRGTGAAAQAWHPGAHYEVRVRAWSCSCPAFVFAAFPAAKSEQNENEKLKGGRIGEGVENGRMFGGLTLGSDMPVCKHLFACVLVEFGGLFKEFVEERVVSVEEVAGWAAGWGD